MEKQILRLQHQQLNSVIIIDYKHMADEDTDMETICNVARNYKLLPLLLG